MADKLLSAFKERQKAELYLSNLEKLREEGSVENLHYDLLKTEYTRMLKDAQSRIDQEKTQFQKVLDTKKKELAVTKLDLKYLEIRYKVGEMSLDTFTKKETEPQRKIAELEKEISQFETLVNSTGTSETHIAETSKPEKKKVFDFSLGLGKKKVKHAPISKHLEYAKPVVTEKKLEEKLEALPVKDEQPIIIDTPQVITEPVQEKVDIRKPWPSGLIISELEILPNRVAAGNHVGIITTAKNNSDSHLQYRIELRINDEVRDYREISLPAGSSEEITFMVLAHEDGEFRVDIGGKTGRYKVLISR